MGVFFSRQPPKILNIETFKILLCLTNLMFYFHFEKNTSAKFFASLFLFILISELHLQKEAVKRSNLGLIMLIFGEKPILSQK